MIIFGGQRGSGTLGDIWSLDLDAVAWRELTPETGGPGGRRYPASAYDARNRGVLVFGGDTGTTKEGDVWLFDLVSEDWRLVLPSGTGPEPRDGPHPCTWSRRLA